MVVGAEGTRGLPLSVSAQGGAWAIEGPGGERLVLERCEPSGDWLVIGGAARGVGGRGGASRVDGDALLLFFETRVLEQKLAGKIGSGTGLGQGHVVGVRELGADETGGYAVRDRYAFSLGDLIRTGTSPSEHVLHEVVGGLLGGLGAIETYGSRPHGDLDADAVVVADVRPRRVRVGLRGVVPERLLGRDLEEVRREELRRVGRLIHHLVTGRAFRELGGYPVRPGADWDRLGKNGEFWRGLVNELLDPKSSRLTLGEVKSRVDQLAYRAPKNRHSRTIAVSAAMGVLAAGGAAAVMLMPKGSGGVPFERGAYEEWMRVTPAVRVLRDSLHELGSEELEGELIGLLGTEGEGDLFDPVGRGKLEEVTGEWDTLGGVDMDLAKMKGRIGLVLEAMETGAEFSRRHERAIEVLAAVAPEAVEKAGRIGGLFSRDEWGALGELESWAEGFEARGWGRAAQLIRDRVEDAEAARLAFEAVLDQGGDESEMVRVGDEDAPARVADAVSGLVEAVSAVEELAARGRDGEGRLGWGAASLAALDRAAERYSGRAELPGDGVYGAWLIEAHGALPERDPVLASLTGMVSAAGKLGDDDGLDALGDRLARVRGVIERVGEEATDGWTAGVDLVALRDRLAWYAGAEPMGPVGDAGELELWLARGEEWAREAGRLNRSASDGRARRVESLRADAGEVEEIWGRVEAVDPARWRPEAAEQFGVDRYTDEVSRGVARVRGVADAVSSAPAWPSIAGTVDGAIGSARAELDRIDLAVRRVAGVVLKTPDELIAEWKSLDVFRGVGGDLAWLEPVVALREEAGVGGVIGRWESWLGGAAGLSDDEIAGSDAADRLRRGLGAIDQVLGRLPGRIGSAMDGVVVGGGFGGEAIRARVRAEMVSSVVSSLGGVGAGWEADDAEDAGGVLDGVVDEAIAGVEARVAAMNTDLDALGGVADRLLAFDLPGEDGAAGVDELDAVLGRMETVHGAFVPARPGRIGAEIDRADVGEAAALAGWVVETLREERPSALLELFAENDAPGAVRFAAIVRAGEVGGRDGAGWPAAVDSMEGDARLLVEGLGGVGRGLGTGDARADRVERLRGIVFGWWARGFERARSESDVRELAERAPGWFGAVGDDWGGMLDPARLEGSAAYNAGALRARARMAAEIARIKEASRGVSRQRSIELGDELARLIRGEIDGLRGSAQRVGRGGWLDALSGVLVENAGGASWDPSQNGPGRALGWQGRLLDDRDPPAVEYSAGGSDAVTLRFSLVQTGNGQVFLCEEEFSVGALNAMLQVVKGQPGWAAGNGPFGVVKDWLQIRGARTAPSISHPIAYGVQYIPRARRIVIKATDAWLDAGANLGIGWGQNQSPAYPEGLLAPRPENPDGNRMQEPLRPTAGHPVTKVSHEMAEAVASLMGCRLPTGGEYRAAFAGVGVGQTELWNLSDRTVERQRAYNAQMLAAGKPALFAPGDGGYASSGNDAAVWPADDGVLWFRGVGVQAGGVRFKNIVGNVGEWVGGERGVVGGSAVSRPTQRPEEVVDPGSTHDFMDVGFRLAIPADDFGSLATALEKSLESTRSSAYVLGGG